MKKGVDRRSLLKQAVNHQKGKKQIATVGFRPAKHAN